MELREYLLILKRRWITVLTFTVLGVLIAAVVTQLTPKRYEAHAKSFVSVSAVTPSDPSASILQASQFSLQRVKSYTGLSDSVTLLQPVIDSLGLNETVAQLSKRVSVTNPLNTVILDVGVTDSSGTRAATIANAVADQLSNVIEQLEPTVLGKPLVKVTVTQRAQPSASPVSPRPSLNLALGLLIGLFLGIAAATLRQQLDRSVRSPHDVHLATGNNPLGLVPRFGRSADRPLVARSPKSAGAQAFRGLRTNLLLVSGTRPRSVVVTSAVGGEGRTVTACNLALTMAQSGLKVCLVEADLRRPAIAKYLGLDPRLGIGDVLRNLSLLPEALVKYQDRSLSVLAAGASPVDPSEMLTAAALGQLFATLGESFDAIIVDAPPLLPVPDARVLASVTDGALIVTKHGSTARAAFTEAVASLRDSGIRILGTALVAVPVREARTFAYHYRETAWSGRAVHGAALELDPAADAKQGDSKQADSRSEGGSAARSSAVQSDAAASGTGGRVRVASVEGEGPERPRR